MADVKIVEALHSFAVYLPDGTPFSVNTHDRFMADDAVVKANPQMFGEITIRSSKPAAPSRNSGPAGVETASAAPGEQRTATRPAAPTAARPAGKTGGKTDA